MPTRPNIIGEHSSARTRTVAADSRRSGVSRGVSRPVRRRWREARR
jgi:hypothetical protein